MGADVKPQLLLVGGSTRAAAWSALRAGLAPVCMDLFADEDLRAVADVIPCARYPHGVVRASAQVPGDVPWTYTGAIENHPRMIERLSAGRRLLGNTPAVVRTIRDPRLLSQAVAECDFPSLQSPEVWSGPDVPPADGSWMVRAFRGAAGRGVAVWNAAVRGRPREPHYFQRRVAGIPISAVCLGTGNEARVLGCSRQWIGESLCGAAAFQYCGSVGPIELPDPLAGQIGSLASCLAKRFGLRGLFGCDFLLDGSQLWLTEVNPRYTASVEVFEFARNESFVARLRDVFRGALEPISPVGRHAMKRPERVVGKAILTAPCDVLAPTLPWTVFACDSAELPMLADVPAPGARIPAGFPVCTVFAEGATFERCDSALREAVERWMTTLRKGAS